MTPEHIRLWRWQHGLSQRTLSELLGVHVLTIKRWERGSFAAPDYLRLALERIDRSLGAHHPRKA